MLIKCPECGKEVSDTSEYCVYCGYKLKKESNETKSFAATRSDAGAIKGLAMFNIIGGSFVGLFGILFIVLGIIASNDTSAVEAGPAIILSIVGALFLVVMFIGIISGALLYHRNTLNKNNQEDLMTYTAGSDTFEAIDFKGAHKTIKVVDYYDIKCNLFTDNIFILYYRNENKKVKAIKLGFCGNREEAKRFFSNLAIQKRAELKEENNK